MSFDDEHESGAAPFDDEASDDLRGDAEGAAAAAPGPRPAPIRRRWSIFGGAGTGVVILATVGTIALGTPQDRSDPSGIGSSAGAGELAADGPSGSPQEEPD